MAQRGTVEKTHESKLPSDESPRSGIYFFAIGESGAGTLRRRAQSGECQVPREARKADVRESDRERSKSGTTETSTTNSSLSFYRSAMRLTLRRLATHAPRVPSIKFLGRSRGNSTSLRPFHNILSSRPPAHPLPRHSSPSRHSTPGSPPGDHRRLSVLFEEAFRLDQAERCLVFRPFRQETSSVTALHRRSGSPPPNAASSLRSHPRRD